MPSSNDIFGLFVRWVVGMSLLAVCMLPAIITILNQGA